MCASNGVVRPCTCCGGVFGPCIGGGVFGQCTGCDGVVGPRTCCNGVVGPCTDGCGVFGTCTGGCGVVGTCACNGDCPTIVAKLRLNRDNTGLSCGCGSRGSTIGTPLRGVSPSAILIGCLQSSHRHFIDTKMRSASSAGTSRQTYLAANTINELSRQNSLTYRTNMIHHVGRMESACKHTCCQRNLKKHI